MCQHALYRCLLVSLNREGGEGGRGGEVGKLVILTSASLAPLDSAYPGQNFSSFPQENSVCSRLTLTPHRHTNLIRTHYI